MQVSRILKRAPMALLALVTLSLLGACSPKHFETEPVLVQTSKGVVTCQLYTRQRLDWDRSVAYPGTMTEIEADQVCIREGRRRIGL